MIPDAYLDGMQVEASTALWDRVLTAGPNTTCVFVAEHGTDIVGFAAGNRLPEPKHGFDAELTAVYLRREFQRAGLGRRLVRAVVEAQRALGATGLITWVIAGNKPARASTRASAASSSSSSPSSGTAWIWWKRVTAGATLAALAAACAVAFSETPI